MDTEAKTIIDRLGGPTAAAKYFGIFPSAISQWLKKGKLPPLRREILRLTRPDLFDGIEEKTEQAAA